MTHPPRVPVDPSNPPLVDPIYTSVKFTADTWDELFEIYHRRKPGFIYSRIGNPTVRQMELLLAELQGREDGLALASGVAAISVTLLSLLKSGDHILHFVESYKPSRHIIRSFLGRYEVRSTMVSIDDFEAIERVMKTDRPTLVYFESPTNPMLKLADLGRLTTLARAYGVLTVMDNTFAGFHQHGEYPVDLYLHSLTKFAGGHGDTTGGIVIGERKLVEKVRIESFSLGAALDPMTASQITRGMKTYFLRYERQCETALEVAGWLSGHACVRNVRYPGLESHPQHALARKQMKDFGTVVAFDLVKGGDELPRFMDRLKLFTLATSLGSTDSLVAAGLPFYGTDLTGEQLEASGISPGTIRLSIGVEAAEDLIADLSQALD